jgi:uncharacterized protein YgiM (DUF1202 family)
MKKNFWLIVAATISTSMLAQDASNSTPAFQAPPPPPPAQQMPPPAADQPAPAIEATTNAPTTPPAHKPKTAKKKTAKKAAAHKAAPELKTVPLVAGPAVVSANHVNVRSKAGLVGEVLTHMTNGEPVTVIEEVQLKKSGPDEPSAWAKVMLPADAHVWLKSSYLDTNNTVTAKKLKLRAGPGENFGVVGIVDKGEVVQPMEAKGDWTQIQAPTNAYAFIAAQYLKQEEAPAVAAAAPETPATPGTVPEAPAVAAAATETPGMPGATNAATDTNPPPVMGEAPPATPAVEEPPPKRIISHEGIVRASFSIQAPTRYALISPDNHQIINYLYAPTPNLDLSRYKGMHIIVTGEEGLDDRWKNTPVITIEKIEVID